MGVGEILGGVFGPSLAGSLSDAYGLAAPCWFLATVAVLGGATALFLRETAPRIVGEKTDPEVSAAFD